MITYYQNENGYVAIDSGVVLRAQNASVGRSLVFGRGPTVAWDPGSVTDRVYAPNCLGINVDASSVPNEWLAALGNTPANSPVKTKKFVSNSGLLNPSKQEVERDRGQEQTATILTFAFGVLVGLIIAYFIVY